MHGESFVDPTRRQHGDNHTLYIGILPTLHSRSSNNGYQIGYNKHYFFLPKPQTIITRSQNISPATDPFYAACPNTIRTSKEIHMNIKYKLVPCNSCDWSSIPVLPTCTVCFYIFVLCVSMILIIIHYYYLVILLYREW